MAHSNSTEHNNHRSEAIFGMCPVCQEPMIHNPNAVVSATKELTVLHDACQDCRTSVLTVTIGQDNALTAVSLLTDLEREEVLQFWSAGPMTADDILDLHTELTSGTAVEDAIRRRN